MDLDHLVVPGGEENLGGKSGELTECSLCEGAMTARLNIDTSVAPSISTLILLAL
jgi:hypothetical protein